MEDSYWTDCQSAGLQPCKPHLPPGGFWLMRDGVAERSSKFFVEERHCSVSWQISYCRAALRFGISMVRLKRLFGRLSQRSNLAQVQS